MPEKEQVPQTPEGTENKVVLQTPKKEIVPPIPAPDVKPAPKKKAVAKKKATKKAVKKAKIPALATIGKNLNAILYDQTKSTSDIVYDLRAYVSSTLQVKPPQQ